MKNIICLAVLFLVAGDFLYGGVGRHNGTINIGGEFKYTEFSPNKGTSQERKDGEREYIGGGLNVELGYLYLTKNTLIHGFDTRLSFALINFNPLYKFGGEAAKDVLVDGKTSVFSSKYVTIGTTYILGTKIEKGRLMIDVLGLNIGWFTARDLRKVNGQMNWTIYENSFLLGVNLPLGTQYIFDNGFMVGFRHRLDFVFGDEKSIHLVNIANNQTSDPLATDAVFGLGKDQHTYLGYNVTVSFGFAIGK